jgi:hypothetical protein
MDFELEHCRHVVISRCGVFFDPVPNDEIVRVVERNRLVSDPVRVVLDILLWRVYRGKLTFDADPGGYTGDQDGMTI